MIKRFLRYTIIAIVFALVNDAKLYAQNDSVKSHSLDEYAADTNAAVVDTVVAGTNGGATGEYDLSYSKKPDAGAATAYPSDLSFNITGVAEGQFFTSSTFTATNLHQGDEASFGVKNGTTTAADYAIKLVGYDYSMGVATEYTASITGVTAAGYDTMDKIAFTIPADLPDGEYYVKVTFNNKTLIGGWGTSLNIF